MGMGGRGVAPSPRASDFQARATVVPACRTGAARPLVTIVLVVVNVVAHLADAFVFQRGIHHHPAFGDGLRKILDEDVLARLERADRGERRGRIGRHDGDGVNLGIFEDATQVAVGFRLVRARLLDDVDRAIDVRAIDVADHRFSRPGA